MKTRNCILIIISVLIIALSSCSIDKRVHRNGYHIESIFSKNNCKNKANETNVFACTEKPEIRENKKEFLKNECIETKETEVSITSVPKQSNASNTAKKFKINFQDSISLFIEKGISSFNNSNTMSLPIINMNTEQKRIYWGEIIFYTIVIGLLASMIYLSFFFLWARIVLFIIVGLYLIALIISVMAFSAWAGMG
jgi:hypothetical protein